MDKVFFAIHFFHIIWRTGRGLYQLFTMVVASGTRICVHLHVSHPLYHCAMDADMAKFCFLHCKINKIT